MGTFKYLVSKSFWILLAVALISLAVAFISTPAHSEPVGSISGKVTDADGNPLGNVSVNAGDRLETWTEPNGQYVFRGLPYGQYLISSPSPSRWSSNDGVYIRQIKKVTVSIDIPNANDISFVLVKGGTISGKVTDAAGNPLANVSINAGNDGDVLTDANGQYVIKGIPFGEYSVGSPNSARWGSNDGVYIRQTKNTAISADSPAASGINFVLEKGGTVSGKITDAAGNPLANISVDAGDGEALTDANGQYVMKGLPFEQYSVGTPNNGRWGSNDGVYIRQIKKTAISADSPVASGINFVLEKGGTVSGKITDAAGNPLTNISVDSGDGEALTDANGQYIFRGIPFGQYSIGSPNPARWGSNDGVYIRQTKNTAVSPDSPEASGINFALVKGGLISGKITDTAGKSLANISVDAGDNGEALTDANGQYVFRGIPFGQYSIGSPNPARWGSNDGVYIRQTKNTAVSPDSPEASGINFALVKGGLISGKITDTAGNPLANISVDAGDNGEALTDAKGQYVMRGLVFGQYTIGTPNPERWGSNDGVYIRQTKKTAVSMDSPVANDISFVLEKGGTISGKVTDIAGNPLSSISVDAGDKGRALTDTNGQYIMKGLPFDQYSVGTPNLARWGSNDGVYIRQIKKVTVSIDTPIANDISFVLEKGGTISGKVTDAAGNPLANISVDAGDGEALTDANGQYVMKGLPFDQYSVSTPNHGRWGSNDGVYVRQTNKVTVSSDSPDTSGINFTLMKGSSISGKITDTAGNPLSNVSVDAGEEEVLTDANGQYVIKGLLFGQYSVGTPSSGRWGSNDDVFIRQTKNTATFLNSPNTSGINFVLEKGGSVSGKITDAAGSPLANISVDVDNKGQGLTDTNGQYVIKGLPFGQYSVGSPNPERLSRNDGVYTRQIKNADISKDSPAVSNINFVLVKGGSISGKATGSPGNPLANVSLDAQDKDGVWNATLGLVVFFLGLGIIIILIRQKNDGN
jgi:inhibitor of cysteine peptidase